jgi:hypothetical protein
VFARICGEVAGLLRLEKHDEDFEGEIQEHYSCSRIDLSQGASCFRGFMARNKMKTYGGTNMRNEVLEALEDPGGLLEIRDSVANTKNKLRFCFPRVLCLIE